MDSNLEFDIVRAKDRRKSCITIGFVFEPSQLQLISVLTAVMPISAIDSEISHYQCILSSLPRSDPSTIPLVTTLARLYNNRYVKSNKKEDLDRTIFHFTHAIFVSRPSWDINGQNSIRIFFLLASLLLQRAKHFDQPSDAQHCEEYFRYLKSQPLEAFHIPCNQVRECLVVALASQMNMGIGDARRHINEMTDHFHELLASNAPRSHLLRAAGALTSTNITDREVQDKVIQCLREANRRLDSHDLAYKLAGNLNTRFIVAHAIDDYEEAMALFDKIISSESNGIYPGPYLEDAAYYSASLAWNRARIYSNPEDIEEAIHRCRSFLKISSTDDFRRRKITELMAPIMVLRSATFGVTEGSQEAQPDVTDVPQVVELTNLESLLALSTTGRAHPWIFSGEAGYLRPKSVCSDLAEIDEAIRVEYCRLQALLASNPPSDDLIFHSAIALGDVLIHAFERTDKSEYLDQSVTAFRDMLEMPIPRYTRFHTMRRLLSVLSVRMSLSLGRDDFEESMQLHSMASKDPHAGSQERFLLSCEWTLLARFGGHPIASTAYETAITLMEETFRYAPTLETQHSHLLSLRSSFQELPMDYASYEVGRGQLKDAIQVLERGRALIWSELRGLRAPINQLPVNSHLEKEFTAVNRELETLTLTMSVAPGPGTVMNDKDGREDGEGMDKFGQLLVSHRKLLAKRSELVSQIQAIPGFGNFMKMRSADDLRSAAASGPVIIINHCRWGCDILIVLHNTDPLLVTTPEGFYRRAVELRTRLLRTRKEYPLESKQYQRALRSVLKSLYELVGQPVIKELRRLNIPEQSRIWWCPTSVFCSLPLHAMGPIPSDDGVPCYFSDLYIPSYTPTLLSLIESRKLGKTSLEKPSILLVANPDDSLQQAFSEIWCIQRLDTKVTTLMGKRARNSAVLEGLRDHRFTHFVCHGNLIPEKPFEASFGLHKDNRLTLRDIVRSRLPDAEFAFLSACHTAELTEGSIEDEGLHLTAAVQYCGFRSVVGTMWAMADQDGSDLAELFYKSLFSSDEPGVPYYERSARALRDAVQALRKKKNLPLEQWVNFVHYGA